MYSSSCMLMSGLVSVAYISCATTSFNFQQRNTSRNLSRRARCVRANAGRIRPAGISTAISVS